MEQRVAISDISEQLKAEEKSTQQISTTNEAVSLDTPQKISTEPIVTTLATPSTPTSTPTFATDVVSPSQTKAAKNSLPLRRSLFRNLLIFSYANQSDGMRTGKEDFGFSAQARNARMGRVCIRQMQRSVEWCALVGWCPNQVRESLKMLTESDTKSLFSCSSGRLRHLNLKSHPSPFSTYPNATSAPGPFGDGAATPVTGNPRDGDGNTAMETDRFQKLRELALAYMRVTGTKAPKGVDNSKADPDECSGTERSYCLSCGDVRPARHSLCRVCGFFFCHDCAATYRLHPAFLRYYLRHFATPHSEGRNGDGEDEAGAKCDVGFQKENDVTAWAGVDKETKTEFGNETVSKVDGESSIEAKIEKKSDAETEVQILNEAAADEVDTKTEAGGNASVEGSTEAGADAQTKVEINRQVGVKAGDEGGKEAEVDEEAEVGADNEVQIPNTARADAKIEVEAKTGAGGKPSPECSTEAGDEGDGVKKLTEVKKKSDAEAEVQIQAGADAKIEVDAKAEAGGKACVEGETEAGADAQTKVGINRQVGVKAGDEGGKETEVDEEAEADADTEVQIPNTARADAKIEVEAKTGAGGKPSVTEATNKGPQFSQMKHNTITKSTSYLSQPRVRMCWACAFVWQDFQADLQVASPHAMAIWSLFLWCHKNCISASASADATRLDTEKTEFPELQAPPLPKRKFRWLHKLVADEEARWVPVTYLHIKNAYIAKWGAKSYKKRKESVRQFMHGWDQGKEARMQLLFREQEREIPLELREAADLLGPVDKSEAPVRYCSRCDTFAENCDDENEPEKATTGEKATPGSDVLKFRREEDQCPTVWNGEPLGMANGKYVHKLAVNSPLGFKVQNITSKLMRQQRFLVLRFDQVEVYWGRTSISYRSPTKDKEKHQPSRRLSDSHRHKHTWKFDAPGFVVKLRSHRTLCVCRPLDSSSTPTTEISRNAPSPLLHQRSMSLPATGLSRNGRRLFSLPRAGSYNEWQTNVGRRAVSSGSRPSRASLDPNETRYKACLCFGQSGVSVCRYCSHALVHDPSDSSEVALLAGRPYFLRSENAPVIWAEFFRRTKSTQYVQTNYFESGLMSPNQDPFGKVLHLVLRCLCEPKSRAARLWEDAQKSLLKVIPEEPKPVKPMLTITQNISLPTPLAADSPANTPSVDPLEAAPGMTASSEDTHGEIIPRSPSSAFGQLDALCSSKELEYAMVVKRLLSSLVGLAFTYVSVRLRYEATDDDDDDNPASDNAISSSDQKEDESEAVPECSLLSVTVLVEEVILDVQTRRKVFGCMQTPRFHRAQQRLKARLKSLRPQPQSFWTISNESPQNWARVCELMACMERAALPTAKICLLTKIFDSIYHEHLVTGHSANNHMGADDLMPVLCFVICRSDLEVPLLTYYTLVHLLSEDQISGISKYYLTMFGSALQHLSDPHECPLPRPGTH